MTCDNLILDVDFIFGVYKFWETRVLSMLCDNWFESENDDIWEKAIKSRGGGNRPVPFIASLSSMSGFGQAPHKMWWSKSKVQIQATASQILHFNGREGSGIYLLLNYIT